MREYLNYAAFGKRVRNRRRENHLTQEELAKAVGISMSFLGHIERGTRKASMETLIRIASALGVTTDELLKDSTLVKRDFLYTVHEPADHFAVIRKELDLLEAKCRGTNLT